MILYQNSRALNEGECEVKENREVAVENNEMAADGQKPGRSQGGRSAGDTPVRFLVGRRSFQVCVSANRRKRMTRGRERDSQPSCFSVVLLPHTLRCCVLSCPMRGPFFLVDMSDLVEGGPRLICDGERTAGAAGSAQCIDVN